MTQAFPPQGPAERVWLHGVGRSGTSWLLKIFDHHATTFCLHEPEARLRDKPKPRLEGPQYDTGVLQDYAENIFTTRDLRAVRKRPVMTKDYRNPALHKLRLGYMYGATALEQGVHKVGADLRLSVPDIVTRPPSHQVVKCVASPYPIDRVVEANPDVRFIFIIRHPCGTVLSSKKGQTTGQYSHAFLPQRPLLSRYFDFDDPYALDESMFSSLELLTYRWSVFNGMAIEAAAHATNLRVLRYEDLCEDPLGVSRELFDWVGLGWDARVEAFLQQSLEMTGDAAGYHDLRRNPKIAAWKWRETLGREDQQTVRRIAVKSPAASLYEDLKSA